MTVHMRPYAGVADLQRLLDLKRACTTPENMYDAPTLSELRALLTPLPQPNAAGRPAWVNEQGRVVRRLYRRAMTQQATVLWVRNDGRLLAYALIAPPSTILTFQVHPQALDSGLEVQMLAWALERMQVQARQRGKRSHCGAAATSTKRNAACSRRRRGSGRFRHGTCAWFACSIPLYRRLA